jgi:hypothetical protein
MEKKVAGFIVAPMWNEFMTFAIGKRERSLFTPPAPIDPNIKPVLAGYWHGENTRVIDKKTGEPATNETAPEDRQVIVSGGEGIHSILYWVNRADPLGPRPNNPSSDSQFNLWEQAVREWVQKQNISENINPGTVDFSNEPTTMNITSPKEDSSYLLSDNINIKISLSGGADVLDSEVYINNTKTVPLNPQTKSLLISPLEAGLSAGTHKIKVVVKTDKDEILTKEVSVQIK